MNTYREEFQAALNRTAVFGLESQQTRPGQVFRMSEADGLALVELLKHEMGSNGDLLAEDVAFKCGQVCVAMAGHVERLTGSPVYLTVGDVQRHGNLLWNFDETNLGLMRRSGSFHVWLTTASYEVLDFTLDLSLRLQKGQSAEGAHPIAGAPDALEPYRWVPRLVGREVALRLVGVL